MKKIFTIASCVALAFLMGWVVVKAYRLIDRQRTRQGPNVLFISVETFRYDRLWSAGYKRPLTPELEALAKGGILFERNYSQAPWTRPSIASTFTSMYPSIHRMNFITLKQIQEEYTKQGPLGLKIPRLDEKFETLAEIFKANGYRCYGWTSNPQIWSAMGFSQGFDVYDSVSTKDPEIVARLGEVFAEKTNHPFFAFVHFFAPHAPYEPDERFRIYDKHPEGQLINHNNLWAIRSGEIKLTEDDMDHNMALYDGEIWQTDERIGKVIKNLKSEDIYDNTIIVVLADHGEEFLDHGNIEHGSSVYNELVHVPFIMAGPGLPKGKVIRAPVQNMDAMPTLIDLVFGTRPEKIQGHSLMPLILDEYDDEWFPAYVDRGRLKAVVDGNWKYILDFVSGEVQLYDLERDPAESNNLAGTPEYEEIQMRLESKIRKFVDVNSKLAKHYTHSSRIDLPQDFLKKMKALGYIQ